MLHLNIILKSYSSFSRDLWFCSFTFYASFNEVQTQTFLLNLEILQHHQLIVLGEGPAPSLAPEATPKPSFTRGQVCSRVMKWGQEQPVPQTPPVRS